jgi:hypothetical protein
LIVEPNGTYPHLLRCTAVAIHSSFAKQFTETYPLHPVVLVQASRSGSYYVEKKRQARVRGNSSVGEVDVLSKRRCPHTGVINFFFADDPYLAVGSVIKTEQSVYLWRCYAEPYELAGTVADINTAERRVAELCRLASLCPDTTHLPDAA